MKITIRCPKCQGEGVARRTIKESGLQYRYCKACGHGFQTIKKVLPDGAVKVVLKTDDEAELKHDMLQFGFYPDVVSELLEQFSASQIRPYLLHSGAIIQQYETEKFEQVKNEQRFIANAIRHQYPIPVNGNGGPPRVEAKPDPTEQARQKWANLLEVDLSQLKENLANSQPIALIDNLLIVQLTKQNRELIEFRAKAIIERTEQAHGLRIRFIVE